MLAVPSSGGSQDLRRHERRRRPGGRVDIQDHKAGLRAPLQRGAGPPRRDHRNIAEAIGRGTVCACIDNQIGGTGRQRESTGFTLTRRDFDDQVRGVSIGDGAASHQANLKVGDRHHYRPGRPRSQQRVDETDVSQEIHTVRNKARWFADRYDRHSRTPRDSQWGHRGSHVFE